MHFIFGLADHAAAVASRFYQEKYLGRRYPDRKAFVFISIHRHLCKYGIFAPRFSNRGRPSCTIPEADEDI
jgi:hypothetical protein